MKSLSSSPIIQPAELARIKQTTELIIIDASAGPEAKGRFLQKHLEGALHVDLDTQLSGSKRNPSKGGRHPLPDLKKFSELLTTLGLTPSAHIIIYDDKGGANAAARFWWMLKSVGHVKVQVLNGGFEAAVKAGYPTSDKVENPTISKKYAIKKWLLPLANIQEVEKVSHDHEHLVIDVRDKFRYDGDSEPIDLIAGHIPGAINIPFSQNLDDQGLYLAPEVLKEKYLKALAHKPAENVIIHCGSGVTACHTLLAMAYAGLEIPKLYVGSWSEWSRTKRMMITKAT